MTAASAMAQLGGRLGRLCLWATFLLPPLLLVPTAKDPFRLPKLLSVELLALASLLFLAMKLVAASRFSVKKLARNRALQITVPLLGAASLGLWTSSHPVQLYEALWHLGVGCACLVGWSLGQRPVDLLRVLRGLLWPASVLSLLGILQFHDLYRPFRFLAHAESGRVGVTSLAGSVGDLAAYLVLPCLIAQIGLWQGLQSWRGKSRRQRSLPARFNLFLWVAALALCGYGIAITQTLTALAALGGSTVVLWWVLVERKGVALAWALGVGVLASTVVVGVAPLRERVSTGFDELRRGDLNAVLSGRLDGWRAAGWMLRQHPWSGVGHGAYAAEFSPAKLALLDQGVGFYRRHTRQSTFSNAHNEYVEAAAELGVVGLLALVWGGWVLLRVARRVGRVGAVSSIEDRARAALTWAGLCAWSLLALGYFPFRVALVTYPALLFLSWLLSENAVARGENGAAVETKEIKRQERPRNASAPGWASYLLSGLVCTALAVGLWTQWLRSRDRLEASRLLLQAEAVSAQWLASRQGHPSILRSNLRRLARAAELDPTVVGIPLAMGSQYLLLKRPGPALEWYRNALELEPRAEIYLNMGRALAMAGEDGARHHFDVATRLNPRLIREVSRSFDP